MESVFTIGWMLSYFLTSSTYLYITAMLTGRMFNASSYRPYMYVIAVITLIASFVPQNINALLQYSNYFSTPRLILCMIVPLIFFAILKHKEVNKK